MDSSDLLSRDSSGKGGVVGNSNVSVASSLLVMVLLGTVDGAGVTNGGGGGGWR